MYDSIALKTHTQSYSHLRLYEDIGKLAIQWEHANSQKMTVGLCTSELYPFVVSVLSVLQNKGVVLPLDPMDSETRKEYILKKNQAELLLTDDYQSVNVDSVNITYCLQEAIQTVPGALSMADFHVALNDSLFEDLEFPIPGMFMQWLSFCTETLKIDFQETLYIYDQIRDLFNFSWLPVLLSGGLVHFRTLGSNIDFHNFLSTSVCVMPLHLMPRFVEMLRGAGARPPSVVITFGRDLIPMNKEKEYLADIGTKWYNFFGFPHLPFVTTITGDGTPTNPYTHKGKPMAGWPCYVLNDNLLLQPYQVPGHLFLSLNETKLTGDKSPADILDIHRDPFRINAVLYQTGLQGVMCPNGIICLAPMNEWMIRSGVCISTQDIERIVRSFSYIIDCAVRIDNDVLQIYYKGKLPLAVSELNKQLQPWLPHGEFLVNWFPTGHIPRDLDHATDFHVFRKMKVLNAEQGAVIQQRLSDQQIDNAVLFSFHATQKEIPLQPLPFKQWDESRVHGDVTVLTKALINQEEKLPDLEQTLTLPDLLIRAAESNKELLFLSENGKETALTYRELLKIARAIACSLLRRGLPKRSKVLFQIEVLDDFISMFWGTVFAGMIPVPLPVVPEHGEKNSASDRMYETWKLLDRPLIVTCERIRPAIESLRHHYEGMSNVDLITVQEMTQVKNEEQGALKEARWEPEETVLLMFTSGSSGKPKGVMLTHRNLISRSYGSMVYNGFCADETTLNWMPFSHVGGVVYFHLRDVYLACNQIHASTRYILSEPTRWLSLIHRHRVTLTWAPHFAFSLINEHEEELTGQDWDLSCVHSILNGAEHISLRDLRTFARILEPYGLNRYSLKPVFGMSETSSGITYTRCFDLEDSDVSGIVPVGHPIPGVSLRIANEHNAIVEEGAVGGLQIRGLTVTNGYYNNEQATRDAFTSDGWFITGDLAWIRDRQLYIAGREKETVSIQGVNYYCQEIEETVMESGIVKAACCAVCSVRMNEQEGEQVAVFFTPKQVDLNDKRETFEKKRLAGFISLIRRQLVERFGAWPDYVIPLPEEEFPKSDIGKIQRSRLKSAIESGQFADQLQSLGIDTGFRIPSWFYRKQWLTVEPKHSLHATPIKTVLVIGRTHQLDTWIPDATREGVRFVLACLPEEADDCTAWLASHSFQIDEILDLTHICQEDGIELPTYHSITLALRRFLPIARALIHISRQRPLHYTMVTRHAMSVQDDESLTGSAVLHGLMKSLALEASDLQVRMIDLDTDQPAEYSVELADELLSLEHGFAAYRNHIRYVPILTACEQSNKSGMPQFLNTEGWVLVTGGLGDVGLHVCRWLLHHFNVKLAIIGTTERGASLEQLRELDPDVLFFKGDLCDSDLLHDAVKEAESKFNRPLSAIFHLAGHLSHTTTNEVTHWQEMEAHLLEQETDRSYDAVLEPKIQGLLALHKLRAEIPDVALVVFSSVVGYFGGVSLSAYAAANGVADAFCEAIRSRYPNTYCFAWSMWEHIGMSAVIPYQVKKLSERSGFVSISPDKALLSMQYALQQHFHTCFIGLDPEGESVKGEVDADLQPRAEIYASCPNTEMIPLIEQKVEQVVQEIDWNPEVVNLHLVESIPRLLNHPEQIDVQRLLRMNRLKSKASFEFNLSAQERVLLAIWKRVLDQPDLDISDNFFDAGGSSVMMTKLLYEIRQQCDVQLSFQDLLQAPTIPELATRIGAVKYRNQEKSGEETPDIEQLYQEVEQVATCLLRPIPLGATDQPPSKILLTGATGFIGEHLLNSLLTYSEATVYCLVRADSENAAYERMRKVLEPYTQNRWLGSRVIPILGDLELERFGWQEQEYGKWAEEIDTILHNGALVNFALPYSRLKPCNVKGTAEVIAFALSGTKKSLHHISTLSLFDSLPDGAIVEEGHTAELDLPLRNGYNQSKWVADRLVQQAFQAGLTGSLFRIGTALGDTLTGRCHTQEFVSLVLKGCIEMGLYPDIKYPLNVLSVDQLALAVVKLMLNNDGPLGEVYHLHPERPLFVNELMEWAVQDGYLIRPLPYTEWLSSLSEQARQSSDPLWATLYGLFPQGEGVFEDVPRVGFIAMKTRDALSELGVEIEQFSMHNLHRMIEYFVHIGFMSSTSTVQ